MKKIIILLLLLSACNIFAAENFKYQIDKDNWKVELLLETCPQELKKAISVITQKTPYKEYVAVLPETIGYEYFKIVFKKKLSANILSPIGSFTTEFRYWKSNGGDKEDNCFRVEIEDFII